MLTKNDMIVLLSDLEESGKDVSSYLTKTMITEGIDRNTLKFINDNRQLDVAKFYEMIRKNYNHNKSSLYKNIVTENEKNPEESLTTLAALNLQILLFAKKLENNEMFLKHSRADEITKVLNNYYRTYDLRPCTKLLHLIRADLKAFESIR